MNCYLCDQAPQSGTMRYAVAVAIGICQHCGIGVCASHSHKAEKPGSSLLCVPCTSLLNTARIPKRVDGVNKQRNMANL